MNTYFQNSNIKEEDQLPPLPYLITITPWNNDELYGNDYDSDTEKLETLTL